MKRIFVLLILFTSTLFYAQSSGITYQAILYNPVTEILPGNNNTNAVLANKDVCLRFSIIDDSSNIEYQETQKVKTDDFGMVNLLIGEGNQVGGYASHFTAIVWDRTRKKLQVDIDVTSSCANFIEISKQDFSIVPYAYASKVAEMVSGIVPISNGGTGSNTVVGAKINLGLNNVDNTNDINKPISIATQTALNDKAPLASPSLTGTPLSPTALPGTNTNQIATTAFVTTAITAATIPDATTTAKGKIKLAGDLGGTADLPIIKNGAVTTTKIASGGNHKVLVTDSIGAVAWIDKDAFGVMADQVTIEGAGTTISPFKVKDLSVVTNKIATASVTPNKMAPGANNTVLVTDFMGNVAWIDSNAFGAVADMTTIEGLGTTTSPFKVKDLAIVTSKLANDAVTTLKIANAAVTTTKIASGGNNKVLVTDNTGVVTWLDATAFGAVADMFTIEGAGTIASPFKVKDLGIITAKLANNAVTTSKIADLNVTTSKIADANITTAKLADLNVTTNKLANAVVTTTKIASGGNNKVLVTDNTGVVTWLDATAFGAVADMFTIEGAGTSVSPFKVKDLGIVTAKLADNAVTTIKIADANVTTAKIANSNVTTEKIADSNVTNAKLATDAVTTGKILDGTITVGDLANNAIETAKIKDLNITTVKIADAAVTTAKIGSGGNNKVLVTDNTGAVVWLDKMAFGAVADQSTIEGSGTTASPFKVKDLGILTAKLADNAVTTVKIADATVTTSKIADATITNVKLATDAVTTGKILDGTIIVGDLANNAVETAKIKDLNVTTTKLADAAVTPTKVASGAINTVLVTDSLGVVAWLDKTAFDAVADQSTIDGAGTTASPFKVKDLGILTAKLADNAVTTIKIADANVTTSKIADATITNVKLATDAVTSAKILNGTLLNEDIADNTITTSKITGQIAVSEGGTGSDMSSTSGYVKQATVGANFTTVTLIPVADVTGAVRKVNGTLPNSSGEVTINWGTVYSGTLANIATVVSTPANGDTYVIANDSSTNNGRTFIYDGTNWLEVTPNQAALDARYLRLSGDIMQGNITVPINNKITLTNAPTNATDAANKAYVDTQITNATPEATSSVKGKIQLAGDLAGPGSSAATPVISNSAITTAKLDTAAVTPTKIASGATNTVLVTNSLGAVAWLDKTAFGAVADQTTIEGAGTNSSPFKVKDLGIITAKLANNAVTTDKIADANVTTVKIADDALTTGKIVDGTIIADDLANNAVTTIKIADANVTNTKLDKTNIPLSGFGAAAADVALGGNKLTGVGNPVNAQDATTKSYVDAATSALNTLADSKIYVGDASNAATEVSVTGDITMNNAGITSIGASKVVTTMIADANVTNTKLDKTNIPLSGFGAAAADVALGGNKLTGVGNPVNAQDATTKSYVDAATIALNTLSDGKIYVGDASNAATEVSVTGDITMNNAGITSIGASKVVTTMIADSNVTTAKIADSNITTTKIADANVTTDKLANASVTIAKIASGGDDKVLVTDNTGVVAWVDKTAFGAVADQQTIEGAGTTASPFKVKDLGIITAKLADNAVTTAKIADGTILVADLANDAVETSKIKDLNVTTTKLATDAVTTTKILNGTLLNEDIADNTITTSKIAGQIAVADGGTGSDMSTSTGYVKQATSGANFTTVTSIPVEHIAGAVQKVNGSLPDGNGNVTVDFGTVSTGILANIPLVTTSGLTNGDIYVVSGDSNPLNNGLTYIFNDSPTPQWLEVTPNQAALDARYLRLAGGTMQGNIVIPSTKKITLTDAPNTATDAVNKAYVDAQIASGAPDATTSLKGKIQLGGDLAGAGTTAATPIITDNAITTNKINADAVTSSKIANGTIETADLANTIITNAKIAETITVANGGTGTTTLTGYVKGNGTNPMTTVATIPVLDIAGAQTTANLVLDITANTGSNTLYPSVAAVEAYVANNATPDATTSSKGKIQLSGDLGGTANAPTVPGLVNKQDVLTLTTTGTGNATLTGATLNIPPQSNATPFNLQSSTNDAGANKTDRIWRTGGVMLGDGVTSSDSFSGYFLAKGDMIANPTIFEFRNTGTVNTGFFASNGGGTNFLPNFRLSSSGTFRSIIIGEIQTDTGGDPAIQFRSQLQNLGPLTVRPTFTWQNGGVGGTEQMRLTAAGFLGINTNPLGRFVSNDNSYITSIPASTANLMDNTGFRPNARFQTTSGVNNNALSLYSTTTSWGVQTHNYSTGIVLPMLLQPAGGNVGIGMATSPNYKLQVIGNARFQYNTNNLGAGGDATWAEFYGKTTDANSQVGGLKLGWYNSFGGVEVLRPGGAVGLGLAFNYAETTAGTTLEGFRLTNTGNVGIGTTAPLQKLVVKGVNAQPATTGTTSNAIVRIEGETNHSLDIGTLANSPYGSYLQSTDKTNLANALPLALNPVGGRVGIGTSNPTSTLEVNGAATNTTAFNAGTGTTIDFSKSNLAYTTASAGAFTLNSMKDGGTYTLAVQGTTSGTSSFTASGFTFKSPNNGVTTASKHTLYTFIVMGTNVYYYMTKGL